MKDAQFIASPMTSTEKQAIVSLAGIYALRMLGLFMILPVLSLFATQIEGANSTLIGLAMGIYGLSQLLLQIPFGLLSDRYGRKKLIIIGLILFLIGSLIAAFSHDIAGLLIGRTLQGAGAISSVVMALVADLTQEVHRTKAMASIGASIALSFGVGMVAGPMIAAIAGLQGVFWVSAVLTALAIVVILYVVPHPPKKQRVHRDAQFVPADAMNALKNSELLRLDYGIFTLHLILMALFVVIPALMKEGGLETGQQWQVYLPIFIVSMGISVPFIILAEKKRQMKKVFLGAILTIAVAVLGLALTHSHFIGLIIGLSVFFCGFNLLEATLPSLVSKTAPADLKGTAMGAYSSSQFLGLFLGGMMGGWFNGHFGVIAVFGVCALLALIWFVIAFKMQEPRYLASLLIPLETLSLHDAQLFEQAILSLKGVAESVLHHEDGVLYLKIDSHTLDKEGLQALMNEHIYAYQAIVN